MPESFHPGLFFDCDGQPAARDMPESSDIVICTRRHSQALSQTVVTPPGPTSEMGTLAFAGGL
jgi:hypothetical protein